MKGYLLLMCGSLFTGISLAQSEQQAIQQWQSTHPTTQFVSEARYAAMSEDERELLGNDLIIYKEKITLSLLENYDQSEKSAAVGLDKTVSLEDRNIMKSWKAANSDVKIIPRSVYESADDARKAIYSENPRCLILEGESLTVKDIERFEQ